MTDETNDRGSVVVVVVELVTGTVTTAVVVLAGPLTVVVSVLDVTPQPARSSSPTDPANNAV